jgi:hypothetical protein
MGVDEWIIFRMMSGHVDGGMGMSEHGVMDLGLEILGREHNLAPKLNCREVSTLEFQGAR